MRVRISATGLYTYPDVTIVCGKPEFEDGASDSFLNPTLLVEVLFKPTEGYDRRTKWAHYQQLASLKECVLVAQHQAAVECYVRQSDGHWSLRDTTELSGNLKFKSVEIEIAVSEIDRNVDFTESIRFAGAP